MNTSAPPHESCMVFNRLSGLADGAIHRMVLGEDREPRALTADEAANELGDPFATLVLLKGVFPSTAEDVLSAIKEASDAGDPLRTVQFFLLGEGSQIPFATETKALRNLRFVVAVGTGQDGPDILVSAFHPNDSDVELMAWDRKKGGFNYYRTVESRAWVFAGNSAHALEPPTKGNGPFESHKSGAFLMKELRAPWINWHSPDAAIQPSVFEEGDPLVTHPWFTGREPGGALVCEQAVARPSITRWARARFDKLAAAGAVENPARILEQLLETPTVNLVCSHTESANAANESVVDLPQTFFVDSETLTELLGLPAPPPVNVPSNIYLQSLQTFQVTLRDKDAGFERPGDTHFAFAVPERAFEDREAVREAIRIGLLSERLVAALLMTDFANPVFSERRMALMAHVPEHATLTGGKSDFPDQMAQRILDAAESTPEGSPEREFAQRWAVGDAWKDEFGKLLSAYYDALLARIATQDGWDAIMRLAETRRFRVRAMPIRESAILFAETNIADAPRSMRSDATVEEQ
jgi:hypothetical protein